MIRLESCASSGSSIVCFLNLTISLPQTIDKETVVMLLLLLQVQFKVQMSLPSAAVQIKNSFPIVAFGRPRRTVEEPELNLRPA